MQWQDVRNLLPEQWVTIEAVEAHTEGAQRVVSDIAIIEGYGGDFWSAWRHYERLHEIDRDREYYVAHTSNAELNVGVLNPFGLRTVD